LRMLTGISIYLKLNRANILTQNRAVFRVIFRWFLSGLTQLLTRIYVQNGAQTVKNEWRKSPKNLDFVGTVRVRVWSRVG